MSTFAERMIGAAVLDVSTYEEVEAEVTFLHKDVRVQLKGLERNYPDGLVKYEPGDLLRLKIPKPAIIRGAHNQYIEAITTLLSGDTKKAWSLIDRWNGPA